MAVSRRKISSRVTFAFLLQFACFHPGWSQALDPLPSWKDGGVKKAIVEFVTHASNEGDPGFVPVAERIAVFDNDGTLWPEKPLIEGMFVLQRIKAQAAKDTSLKNKEPFKAALTGDTVYLKQAGEDAVAKLVAESHTGMTQEEFASDVEAFSKQATYPKPAMSVTAVAYLPMVELLSYLRGKGFETWICSGGTVEFMRVFSQSMYGIPPKQVIGTAINLEFESKSGRGSLLRKPGIAALNDKAGKPVGISRHIGLRPVLAAGNVRSGGDIAMLTYSQSGANPSLQLLINHDDAKREFAYQEADGASLKAAKAQNWHVVSMKNDWKAIFRPSGGERVGAASPEP